MNLPISVSVVPLSPNSKVGEGGEAGGEGGWAGGKAIFLTCCFSRVHLGVYLS